MLFEFQAIIDSDQIMSFANHGSSNDLKYVRNFWFNMENFPGSVDEEILTAELRLYKGDSTITEDFDVRLIQLHGKGSHGDKDELAVVTFAHNSTGM